MKKIQILLCLIASFLLSCSDVESIATASKEDFQSSTMSSSSKARTTSVYDFGLGGYVTTYDVNPTILGYFQHYWQNKTPRDITPDQAANSCGATSYMMIANCLALSKGLTYGVTKEKQKHIYDKTKMSGVLYTNIGKLRDYCNTYDNSFLTPLLSTATSNRTTFKNTLEAALADNKFLIVGVNAYVGSASTLVHTDPYFSDNPAINPDLREPSLGQKYITGESVGTYSGSYYVGGHIIIIIAIKKNPDGSGVVTYIDPISQTRSPSNRKYVNYTRLLDAIQANSSGSQYQYLSIYGFLKTLLYIFFFPGIFTWEDLCLLFFL